MKILEVRDGFIKFESDSSICLSSFIQVSGLAKNYIAQIVQIKHSDINSVAVAKILFLYDGSLQPYDKTLPSDDAQISDFTFNILNNSINAAEPVIAGVMPDKDLNIIIDSSAFNKKMLMSIDDKEENNILIRNLTKQFNNLGKNVLIIDTLGVINAKKYTAGEDFKLPLDTASLAFMYQDCLNDATGDSKALIVEIFRDLAEYSKTVPFVPFEALKNIVDEMVDRSHVFKLLVLKNKLAKFDRLGYFAKDKNEADKVQKILNSKCAVIDLSKLDSAFQNRYLAFLYEKLQEKNSTQVFLELSNTISRKNLKNILEASTPTAFITHSRFKYLNDIKNLFDNFIISPSLTNNEIFKIYNTFLKTMQKGSYLIAGEAVNYIPLVSSARVINEIIPVNSEKEIIQEISKPAEESDKITSQEDSEQQEPEIVPGKNNTPETGNDVETTPSSSSSAAAEEEKDDDGEEVSPAEEDASGIHEENVEDAEEISLEIIEPEIVTDDTVQENEDSEENIIEERKITNEEIFANIAEKSDAIISDAAKDLTELSGNMFENDGEQEDNKEEEENSPKEIEETINIADELQENEEYKNEILEELSLEPDIEDKNIEEVVNQHEQLIAEDSDNNEQTENIEFQQEVDTIQLEEAFESKELEQPEEIQDYVPEENQNDNSVEALDLVEETENIDSELSENTLTEELREDNEIEIPEDFDLDFEADENHEELINNSIQEETVNEEPEILPVSDDSSDFDDIIELDPDEADENDIVIDMTDDDENNETAENLDEQIVKDVDKVFTTRKDDDISDSDLDFIDELNNDDTLLEEVSDGDTVLEELSDSEPEDGIIEETPAESIELKDDTDNDILETRNSSTPIVPVYDADIPQEDMVISDPIQQGDTVTHAKYGSGVVEKMIKYGNKTLFSINFDNIGRRLLDPTLTEIKKA